MVLGKFILLDDDFCVMADDTGFVAITQAEYARHRATLGLRGGTPQGVRKAINSGRLIDSVVVVGKKKKIRLAVDADSEWAKRTMHYTQVDQNGKYETVPSPDPAGVVLVESELCEDGSALNDNGNLKTDSANANGIESKAGTVDYAVQIELGLGKEGPRGGYLHSRARTKLADAKTAEIRARVAEKSVLEWSSAEQQITTIGRELALMYHHATRSSAVLFAAESDPQAMRVMLQDFLNKCSRDTITKLRKEVTADG